MKFSNKTILAIKALKLINWNTVQCKLTSYQEMSKTFNCSVKYLQQVMKKLKDGGLQIVVKKGPTGGFKLNEAAYNISLLRILEAMGELPLAYENLNRKNLDDRIKMVLTQYTLADLSFYDIKK